VFNSFTVSSTEGIFDCQLWINEIWHLSTSYECILYVLLLRNAINCLAIFWYPLPYGAFKLMSVGFKKG